MDQYRGDATDEHLCAQTVFWKSAHSVDVALFGLRARCGAIGYRLRSKRTQPTWQSRVNIEHAGLSAVASVEVGRAVELLNRFVQERTPPLDYIFNASLLE